MKLYQIITLASTIGLVAAQTLESLPDCGKLCVNNMLAKAKELGCADGDVGCLCKNIDFAYGIRDCSSQTCGAQAAGPVITYGANYCKSSGNNGGANGGNNGGNGTGVGNGTPNGPSDSKGHLTATPLPSNTVTPSGTGPSSAIITSALVSTISSGDGVHTSTYGFTTIYGTHTGVSSTETSMPTDSAHPSETSNHPSSSTSGPSPSSSGEASSTSSGSGARQTACAGLAAAAGLAAMLL